MTLACPTELLRSRVTLVTLVIFSYLKIKLLLLNSDIYYMVSKFFLNFWIWWYLVFSKELLINSFRNWLHFIASLNLVTMFRYLFVPMYQDYSFVGRMTSFLIRIVWVVIAFIVQLFYLIPLVIFNIFVVLLPIVSVIMIISFFI